MTLAPMPATRHLLRTFGVPELRRVEASGDDALVQRGGKPLALLVWLACHPGRDIPRATLADLLWGEDAPANARKSLRQAVFVLRGWLGDSALLGDGETLRLAPDAIASDRATLLAADTRGDIEGILAAYRAPFCDGLEVRGASTFVQWVEAERERLARTVLRALQGAVPARIGTGATREAVRFARAFADAEPDRPEALALLADALVADGAAGEAMRALEEFCTTRHADGDEVPDDIARRVAQLERSARRGAAAPKVAPVAPLGESLVARDDILATLLREVEAARHAATRRLVLVGPAGIGKSRVLDELEARLRLRTAHVVRVRFVSGMRAVPGAALVAYVRALAELPGALGVGEATAGVVVELVPELRGRFASAAPVPGDADARRRAFVDAIADLLAAVAESRLTVVLRDDDHHADDESRAVLQAVPLAGGLRLLEVATTRVAPPASDRGPAIHRLAPLRAPDVRELLAATAALPEAAWAEVLVHELAVRCTGVPQRVLQAVRSLEADGLLTVRDGAWTTADPAALGAALPRVTEPADALARLGHRARTALDVLAYWRWPTAEADLVAVLGTLMAAPPVEGWAEVLRELESLGLVVLRGPEWQVAHDSVADACAAARTPEMSAVLLDGCLRVFAAPGRASLPVAEHLALLCGAAESSEAAERLVRRALRTPRLRLAAGGRAQLLARLVTATGRPEWERSIRRAVGWFARQTPAALAAASSIGTVAAAAVLWLLVMLQPRLVVESPPLAHARTGASIGLIVQPRVVLRDGFGRLLEWSGIPVRTGATGLQVLGDTIGVLHDGRLQFERLSALGDADAMRDAPIPRLRFRGPWWMRDADVPLGGVYAPGTADSLRIIRILVNGRAYAPGDTIVVEAGTDSLRIGVTYAFSTIHPTANYVFGFAGSWLPKRDVVRIAGLPRPVLSAWQTSGFTVPAPRAGGHRLLLVMGLNDSAEHLLSHTSWMAGAAVWDDGNDLIEMPDSVFRALQRDGMATIGGYVMAPLTTKLGGPAFAGRYLEEDRSRVAAGSSAVVTGTGVDVIVRGR